MNIQKFNLNKSFLCQRLFQVNRPHMGASTYLNVNLLPDLLQYIKQKLHPTQQISLSDYRLQTYIMQLSIKQPILQSFDELVQKILAHIRINKEFWIGRKLMQQEGMGEKEQEILRAKRVTKYHQHIQKIRNNTPIYQQRQFSNHKIRRIQQFKQLYTVSFIDKHKEVLKQCFTNYSMMPAYVFNTYCKQSKTKKYDQLTEKQKKSLKTLEYTVQYFLLSKRSHQIKRTQIKTRELMRNRRMPSYMHNSIAQVGIPYQNPSQVNSQESCQSQQDSANVFFKNYRSQIKSYQITQGKTNMKQKQINQCHNMLQVLNCLLYLQDQRDQQWFQSIWTQLEDQRALRKDRQQDSYQDQDQSQSQKIVNQDRSNQLQNQQCDLHQKQKLQIRPSQILKKQSQISIENEKIKESQQNVQIGVKKPIFDQTWKNPNLKFDKLCKNLQNKIMSIREVYFLSREFLNQKLQSYSNYHRVQSAQQNRIHLNSGLLIPTQQLDKILLQYQQQLVNPQNTRLSLFKTSQNPIPWSQSQYLLFLQGLIQYFFIPTNNRKIAQFMSKTQTIQANHVKYVKALYLKNMALRMDKGQIGGGKKGRSAGKVQFVKKDVQNFNIRYFDKLKKGKKRRNRRRDQDGDDVQDDADSLY